MRYGAAFLLFVFFATNVDCAAQTVRTQGNCSPVLQSSTVDGSVTVNCSIDQQDLDDIAKALNVLQRENKLSAAQMQGFLQVTNTMLASILAKESHIATASSTIKDQISRVLRLQQEELAILHEASQGTESVSSTNQFGGVTALSIGTVNQNTAADRSKYIKPLQQFYAQGVAIRQALLMDDLTDDQIDTYSNSGVSWINTVATWLVKNMNVPAEARFVDSSGTLPMSWDISGSHPHKPEELKKRNNVVNLIAGCLRNLETLINSDNFDP